MSLSSDVFLSASRCIECLAVVVLEIVVWALFASPLVLVRALFCFFRWVRALNALLFWSCFGFNTSLILFAFDFSVWPESDASQRCLFCFPCVVCLALRWALLIGLCLYGFTMFCMIPQLSHILPLAGCSGRVHVGHVYGFPLSLVVWELGYFSQYVRIIA